MKRVPHQLKDANGLNARQRAVYRFMLTFLQVEQRVPTFAEIGNALGLSSGGMVALQVERLKQVGLVRLRKKASSSFQLVGVNLSVEFADDSVGTLARSLLENTYEDGSYRIDKTADRDES